MSSVLNEVLEANSQYSSTFGVKGDLALPPARRIAILTCMDARLDPAKFAGLAEGDAHVIRPMHRLRVRHLRPSGCGVVECPTCGAASGVWCWQSEFSSITRARLRQRNSEKSVGIRPEHVSFVAGRDRSSDEGAARIDAACLHPDGHEYL